MRVNLFIHPLYVCCILTMIGLFLDLRGCSATNTCRATTHQNPADGVCGSVTIRTLEQFDRLQNCTVVEGFVKIMLVKLKNAERFPKSLSFPLLREIDHFLMIYRIDGLRSLEQLFPNLAVIRGSELFYNYALVAYENKNLEELGLINLQVIKRGAVRLNKNKKLCYIDTIDWGRLAVDVLPSEHNFNDNKDASQCVDHCLDECPVTDYNKVNARRCWTGKHCQLNLDCPDHCGNGSCMANGVCCHDYCIGGCEGIGPDKCLACKHVVYNGKCQPECDPWTYKFANRRCLTDQECLNLRNRSDNVDGKRPLLLKPGEKGDDGLCVMSCPSGYTVAKEGKFKDLTCVKCQGFCPKECNGTDVNSIQKAQQLHGCSKIIGHLIIQIVDSSSAVDVLEEHLGNIREVTSSITIRKSYALLNLNFFKRLEIIGGEQLNNLGQSLVVMDNANLQELFPEDIMKNLVIKNGKVSFHYNRQLCVYKISEFVNYLNLTEAPTEADISSSNNGDLLPCMKQELQLEVKTIYHNAAVLVWDKDRGDERNLLTYMINYKEIEDKNVNIHQGRDACSDEVWTVKEHSPSETKVDHEIGMVSHLKPYTMYAVYVQAYTLSTATHSALTHVQTFITDPYYPSEPRDLEVTSENPQELHVTWKPPKYPNGNVTHYVLNYFKQVIDPKSYARRNYCKEPIQTPKVDNTEKVSKNEEMKNISDTCCACPKSKKELEQEARKQEIEVYFENFLQNNVYCKRYDKLPPEISVDFVTIEELADKIHDMKSQETGQQPTASDNDWFEHDFNMTKIPTDRSTESENHGDTHVDTIEVHKGYLSATLSNLEPFTEYIIEIQACQNTNTSPSVDTKLCSNREIISGRTKANWELDKINETSITYETIKTNATIDVLIKWDPPERPNGLILMYYISYKRVWNGQQNIVPQQICISQVEYGKYNGTRIKGLEVGNWTYWINAVSLAGNSSQTKEHFFLIPSPPGGNDTSYVFIIIVIIVVIVVLVICIAVACLYAKYKFRREDMTVISTNANYVPSEHMYIMDSWEVDRDKIKLVRELGQGSFGMVYEGTALDLGEDPDVEIRVAVKTVNDRASFNDKREFLKEATTMKAFDCYHVVKLLGVVSHGQPALVIMELMALGDLKNYLREHRPDEHERPGVSPPRLLDILQMAGEIADGMAYLAAKKFVHRDLAARNCMVDEDKTVKIGDFGMTRDIYETDYYRKGGKGMLPVRWMAPESLRDGVFTTMSDVWSYGVVMWEMVTLAAQPYQGLSNEEVVKFISSGNTMDMPDNCPEEMAHLMQRCWARKPKCRPTFMDIIEYLLPNLNSRFDKVSYFFNEGGGPVEGGRGGNLEPPADEDDEDDDHGAEGGEEEDFSDNGSSLEGAAALPLNGSRDRDFPLDCVQVTHPSYGRDHNGVLGATGERDSFYQFNEMPENAGHDSNHLKGSLEGENFINDCGRSDSSRSFIGGDNHFVPHTTTPHSALPGPSHRNGDGLTGLNDAGVIELQPLIGDDKLPPAENLFSLPSPNSDQSKVGSSASRYPGYQRLPLGASSHPSSSPTNSLPPSTSSSHGRMDRPSAPHHRQGASRPSQSLGASSSSSQSSSPSSPPPLLSAASTAAPQTLPPSRPSLRLPVLNQPPGGGFRQVPLFNSGTRDNNKNFPYRNSGGYPPYQPTSALSSAGNSHNKLPAMDTQLGQGDQQSEGINDSPLIAHSSDTSPQASATGNGSSDARKDSTNNSDNYSQMNGLTNGFVNWHRTAPC